MGSCALATWTGWAVVALGVGLWLFSQRNVLLSRWHEHRARKLEARPEPPGDPTAISRHRARAADHRLAAEAHDGPLQAAPVWALALIGLGLFLRPAAALLGAECG